MSNETNQKNYGGYYVIDGIQERSCDSLYPPQRTECQSFYDTYGFSLLTDFSVGIPRSSIAHKTCYKL